MSPRDNTRSMSKNGVSYHLRDLIVQAHRSLDESDMDLLKVKAHDIRGIATSFNFWVNRSIQDVLKAATWKTASVFAKHYFRDIERFSPQNMLYSLGPIVAAGGIVGNR